MLSWHLNGGESPTLRRVGDNVTPSKSREGGRGRTLPVTRALCFGRGTRSPVLLCPYVNSGGLTVTSPPKTTSRNTITLLFESMSGCFLLLPPPLPLPSPSLSRKHPIPSFSRANLMHINRLSICLFPGQVTTYICDLSSSPSQRSMKLKSMLL